MHGQTAVLVGMLVDVGVHSRQGVVGLTSIPGGGTTPVTAVRSLWRVIASGWSYVSAGQSCRGAAKPMLVWRNDLVVVVGPLLRCVRRINRRRRPAHVCPKDRRCAPGEVNHHRQDTELRVPYAAKSHMTWIDIPTRDIPTRPYGQPARSGGFSQPSTKLIASPGGKLSGRKPFESPIKALPSCGRAFSKRTPLC